MDAELLADDRAGEPAVLRRRGRDGLRRGNLDAAGPATPTQLSFFGAGGDATNLGAYNANKTNFDANVRISTPITADASGNIYFGYQVQNAAAVGGLDSGLARIDATGHGTFVTAASLAPAGDTSIRTSA